MKLGKRAEEVAFQETPNREPFSWFHDLRLACNAGQVCRHGLDVGLEQANVIGPCNLLPYAVIAAFIVNG